MGKRETSFQTTIQIIKMSKISFFDTFMTQKGNFLMVNFVLSVNPAENHKTMRRLIAWAFFFHVVPVVFLRTKIFKKI